MVNGDRYMRKGVIKSSDIKEYLEKYDGFEVVGKLAIACGVPKEIVEERVMMYKKANGLLKEEVE